MSEIRERMVEAREHVRPVWTAERERAVRARIERRLKLERRRRAVALSFAMVALVAAGLFAWHRASSSGGGLVQPTAQGNKSNECGAATELLRFPDGTTAIATTTDARVVPLEIGPTRASVELASGAARFSVTPDPKRTFRVVARGVTVTVLGTVFVVGIEPEGVRVTVERGRVHVAWPSGERDVSAGDALLAGAEPPVAPAEPPAEPSESPAASAALDRTPKRGPNPMAEPSWRVFAADGDYTRAFARLSAEGPSAVHDDAGDLLLAADVARLGGHADKAVAHLQRVVSAHAGDPRAPLAAFTLGRTLLDQLGRPGEAAEAFATARRLDPSGAMSEDALAREVEGWSRAGNATLAHERALAYAGAYPRGRRLDAVRRLGGIE